MEETLLNQFKQILDTENVTGCVLADSQGLCLLASPNVKPDSAGLVSAIAQHAVRIDESAYPLICLEGSKRQCLIQGEGAITTAVFKKRVMKQSLP